MDIISEDLNNRIYNYFVVIFRYKIGKSCVLKSRHVAELSRAIGITKKHMINVLELCKWCSIEKRTHCILYSRYYITIDPIL